MARWAHLAARAETDPASWVFTQLNVLERELVMTPLARAAAGVTLEPAGGARRGGEDSPPRARRSKLSPDVRAELARLRRDDPLGALDDDDERGDRRGRGVVSDDDLAALLYLADAHPDDFVRCACAARALELRGAAVTEAPTGGEVGPQSPVPPKLVASDRRGVDARRWEFVIPPSLAAELGDSTELEHHRDTFKRWEAAAARVGDLRRRHAEALEHDRAAELEFAAGAKRKLAEPTAPPLELELVGAQRAVEVLERELVAAGSRLFAASLEHVPVAARALERATPAPAVPLPAVELAQRVTRCSCRCSASYCSAVRRTNACNAAGPDCQEHLMADQLPSGRWRGRVRHPITGKQVTPAGVIGGPKTFVTRREAERAEDTARDALVDAAVRGRTVREFWTDWTTSELWARPAESTNRHNAERTAAFVAMFGERPLASIGGPDVAAYLEGGQRRGTVPRCARCSTMRAAFSPASSSTATRSRTSGCGRPADARTSSRPTRRAPRACSPRATS